MVQHTVHAVRTQLQKLLRGTRFVYTLHASLVHCASSTPIRIIMYASYKRTRFRTVQVFKCVILEKSFLYFADKIIAIYTVDMII